MFTRVFSHTLVFPGAGTISGAFTIGTIVIAASRNARQDNAKFV